jgi:hypothetical protein
VGRAPLLALLCVGVWLTAWLSATPGVALAQAPTITSVAPDSGEAAGGTTVTVQGSGFNAGASVSFAGQLATEVSVSSPTLLTAVSPPGSGTIDVSVSDSGGTSPVVGHDWYAYEAAPDGYWLGLNGNSASNAFDGEPQGPVDEFARDGIVYDRSFELTAGQLPSETEADSKGGTLFEDKLRLDHEYGMIPVSPIEYSGYRGNLSPDPGFPQETRTGAEEAEGKTTIAQYVAGFVKSASAIIGVVSRDYPGMPILLEPMNEPWGYTTPVFNGAEYARVIAKLLPAARAAGIPLSDIYVSAFGADAQLNERSEAEYFTPGWVAAMYAAEPGLRSEIQGWYFHPYGPPSGTELYDSWGIQSVAEVRKQMSSGENNIIVSEVGYCASEEGGDCNNSGQSEVHTRQEAAERLTAMLDNALPYYEAGWLKALIVYGRGDGGWAMVEEASKRIDSQGDALEAFALAHGKGVPPAEESCGPADLLGFKPATGSPMDAQSLAAPIAAAAICGGEVGGGGAGQPTQPTPVPINETPPTANTLTQPAPAAKTEPAPLTSLLPPAASARLTLERSLIKVRGRTARISLSCVGEGRCAGRATLTLKLANSQRNKLGSRQLSIGYVSFSLAPSHSAESLNIVISVRGRELLRTLRGTAGHFAGTLLISQTLTSDSPSQSLGVELALAR